MTNSKVLRGLLGLLFALAAVALVVWSFRQKPDRGPLPASNYYTGPMQLNRKHPDMYTTDDGKIVPAPPGETKRSGSFNPLPGSDSGGGKD